MNKIRSLTQKQLFLPIFCVFLVLCSNIIYDIAQGNAFYNFFSISIKNGVLYGRIIDILNRGSEVAILAMGMYVQSVGINKKASRIAGLNSQKIIFLCYVLCGLCAAIAGIVSSSRTSNADSNNIGLNYELDAILAVALGATAWAAASSTWPAPSLAHTPSRPSRLLSTPWASPPRSRRYSKPSWS